MKKILSVCVALAVLMVLCPAVLADSSPVTNTSSGASINVSATYSTSNDTTPVISVDVAWGAMNFTYHDGNTIWDTTEHEYVKADGTWTAEGNDITITNHSNAQVKATLEFSPADGLAITGTWTDDIRELTLAAVTDGGEATTATSQLTISGNLAQTQQLGTIIVTLSDDAVNTYAELQAALNELNDGDTYKLPADINLGWQGLTVSKNITLDLNGHQLTSGVVEVTANTTMIDSVGTGEASMVNVASGATATVSCTINSLSNNGTMNVTGGNISYLNNYGTVTVSGGTHVTLENYGGTMTVTGGTIGGIANNETDAAGTVTVSGATVTDLTQNNANGSMSVDNTVTFSTAYTNSVTCYAGTMTVENDAAGVSFRCHGGTMTVTAGDIYVVECQGGTMTVTATSTDKVICSGGTMTINGATTASIECSAGTLTLNNITTSNSLTNSYDSTVKIYGGNFNSTLNISGDLYIYNYTADDDTTITPTFNYKITCSDTAYLCINNGIFNAEIDGGVGLLQIYGGTFNFPVTMDYVSDSAYISGGTFENEVTINGTLDIFGGTFQNTLTLGEFCGSLEIAGGSFQDITCEDTTWTLLVVISNFNANTIPEFNGTITIGYRLNETDPDYYNKLEITGGHFTASCKFVLNNQLKVEISDGTFDVSSDVLDYINLNPYSLEVTGGAFWNQPDFDIGAGYHWAQREDGYYVKTSIEDN